MTNSAKETYPAYLTTAQVGGIREPILGERIVIDLGEDANGNLRELSIDLTKHTDKPGTIIVYAIVEPLPNRVMDYLPLLKVKPECAMNAAQLVVSFKARSAESSQE